MIIAQVVDRIFISALIAVLSWDAPSLCYDMPETNELGKGMRPHKTVYDRRAQDVHRAYDKMYDWFLARKTLA